MFVLDAVFFQQGRSGIARQWQRALAVWAGSPFAGELVVVDRGGTCPRLPGIAFIDGPPYRLAVDLAQPIWQEKARAIGMASEAIGGGDASVPTHRPH